MLNSFVVMGRLTANPELKTTSTGFSVCSFTIACERDYAGSGEERKTDFFNIVAWKHTAEFICRNFTKGRMISIKGRWETRFWTDKNGTNRKEYEVIVENAYFADYNKPTSPDSMETQHHFPASVPQQYPQQSYQDTPSVAQSYQPSFEEYDPFLDEDFPF